MEFRDVLASRRSCREYDDRPVPREVMDGIVEAASRAPSSMNRQPTRLHFVTGARRDLLAEVMALSTTHLQEYVDVLPDERIKDAARFFSSLGDAPVVCVLSVPHTTDELTRINDLLATGCVMDNVLLAATDAGMACCPITFGFWVRDQLADAARIPQDRYVAAMIVMGYPDGEPESPAHRMDIAEFLE